MRLRSGTASSRATSSRRFPQPSRETRPMHRSEITIDLGAIRHNARRLLDALAGSELWAVVKANGYGHGAVDVARAAVEAGASALCVVTVAEGIELRRELPEVRILVMCPTEEV